MKALAIVGSPRKNGNTEILVRYTLKAIEEEGIDTELVHLGDVEIKPCTACMLCKKEERCPIDDDLFPIYLRMKEADAIILASPVYFGSATAQIVKHLLSSRRHPEQGYRSSLGLLRLESRFGKERLEAACHRALCFGLHSYKGVKNILEAGLDKVTLEEPVSVTNKSHLNIRGTKYYS